MLNKIVIAGALAALSLMAQDDAKLVSLMKSVGPTCSGVGKKLQAKDATAAADAKKLQAMFKEVQGYWKKKKADDGVTFSKDAGAAFKAVEKHAAAGKWDEATASFKEALKTCSGCHTAHREKAADGSWKIK